MEVAVLLFFVALLLHGWIGLRDVVIDYVHPLGLRMAVLGAVALGQIALGLWVAVIFARLG
jgi:succinate dehydrogenase / fumarate reductase membrane anchor subunit